MSLKYAFKESRSPNGAYKGKILQGMHVSAANLCTDDKQHAGHLSEQLKYSL